MVEATRFYFGEMTKPVEQEEVGEVIKVIIERKNE